MGAHMATNLHKAGLLHGLWNRTCSLSETLAQTLGCQAYPTAEALATQCEVLVLCVSADADVLHLVKHIAPHLQASSIVIDCSTTSPATARAAAAILSPLGAQFMDCPVTGGTEGARLGTLAILGGGEEATWDRALAVLQSMGGKVTRFGPVGAGQTAKAVNQIMVAGVNQAVTEGMALAAQEGLPLQQLIDTLGSGAAGSWFLTNRAPNMLVDEYPLGFQVQLHAKDLAICQQIAAEHAVKLPLVEMTLVHYERLLSQYGAGKEEDISSLYRLKAVMFANAEKSA